MILKLRMLKKSSSHETNNVTENELWRQSRVTKLALISISRFHLFLSNLLNEQTCNSERGTTKAISNHFYVNTPQLYHCSRHCNAACVIWLALYNRLFPPLVSDRRHLLSFYGDVLLSKTKVPLPFSFILSFAYVSGGNARLLASCGFRICKVMPASHMVLESYGILL